MKEINQSTIIPVVLFVYNRPNLLDSVLKSLKNNKIPLLFIFSDGAKNESDVEKVQEVRKKIKKIDWCQKIIVEHDINMGLGKSIKFGVSMVLSEYTAAIVFEDDLICVKGAYHYLKSALINYQYTEEVISITGWAHPKVIPDNIKGMPYFDGKAECWSWGTWARAWHGMEKPAIEIYNSCVRQGIDIEKYGSDMPKMALEAAEKNLWAVGWWYLHMLKGALCLRPPQSLIETIGWDGTGTTITPEMKGWANPPLKKCPSIPEHYPEPIENEMCPNLWKMAIDNEPSADLNPIKEQKKSFKKIDQGVWIIENLLTKIECEYLILKARAKIFKKAKDGEKYGRYNQETFINNDGILNLLRARLSDRINACFDARFSTQNTTSVLEIYLYNEGDFVSPHSDTPISLGEDVLTNYTLVVYLNDDFEGGETFFLLNNLKMKTKKGGALLFNQSLVHGGLKVLQGNKYIVRLCIYVSGL